MTDPLAAPFEGCDFVLFAHESTSTASTAAEKTYDLVLEDSRPVEIGDDLQLRDGVTVKIDTIKDAIEEKEVRRRPNRVGGDIARGRRGRGETVCCKYESSTVVALLTRTCSKPSQEQ